MLNCLRARLLDNEHAPLTPLGTLPADATLMTGGLEWFRESFASEALRGKGLLFIRLWPGRLMELRMHKGILYLTVARQCARRHCCGVSPARLRNTRMK